MLAKIAKADGNVSRSEISFIDAFFTDALSLDKDQRAAAIKQFNEAKNSDKSFRHYAESFYAKHHNDTELLIATTGVLLRLAMADEEFSHEEKAILNQCVSIFGLEEQDFQQHFETEQPQEPRKDRAYHANVLGVEEHASFADIKTAYRKLCRQYHPDKVTHLGSKLKEVAEEELKRINESYSYFKALHSTT